MSKDNYKEYTVRVFKDGARNWFQNNVLHREDGPAVELLDGKKVWYFEGNLHRFDGPAIEYPDGSKSWFLKGLKYSEEEFLQKTAPHSSCDGKVVEIDGRKYKLTEVQE